jgi:hypothetical protein
MAKMEYTYKTMVSIEEYFNAREDDLFFQSKVFVFHKSSNIWNFLKNLKNLHLWHPHMYFIRQSIHNSPEMVIYGNYFLNHNYEEQVVSVDSITEDDNIKTIRCKIENLLPTEDLDNFFELSVETVSDNSSYITFKRFKEFIIGRPRLHHEVLTNIATDISYRLMNLEYDSIAYLRYQARLAAAAESKKDKVNMNDPVSYYYDIKLPQLPDYIIQECYGTIGQENSRWDVTKYNRLSTSSGEVNGATYKRYDATQLIVDWVQSVTSIKFNVGPKVGIQIFQPYLSSTTYSPHTDGQRGDIIVNYLLEEGGDNVETLWYIQQDKPLVREPGINLLSFEDLAEVHKMKFNQGQWFAINGRILHTVVGITKPRISLSVGFTKEEFAKLMTNSQ